MKLPRITSLFKSGSVTISNSHVKAKTASHLYYLVYNAYVYSQKKNWEAPTCIIFAKHSYTQPKVILLKSIKVFVFTTNLSDNSPDPIGELHIFKTYMRRHVQKLTRACMSASVRD